MPQFYSLDEAARVLGLSPDELKEKAQQRKIRAFMDSGSWRFRVADIDEEARRRGIGSDPELSLSDLDLVAQGESGSGDDIDLTEFQLGVVNPDLDPSASAIESTSTGQGISDSDADILLDDISSPAPPGSSSSTIIGMAPKGKLPSDSDVKLVPDYQENKQPSDSDVRLGTHGPSDSDVRLGGHGPSDSDVTLFADEEGSSQELEKIPPKREIKPSDDDEDPNATMLRPSPMIGSSEEIPAATEDEESESDFELTPSSVIDALEPESGSDFELTPLDASSDEFETEPLRGPSDSDVTGAEPSTSGVNLGRPSDSGINLQSVGNFDLDSADSIELAPLEDDDEPKRPTPKPKPAPVQEDQVDLSATALPVRGDKDIFEDTDFEVDALESGHEDQTVQLEAQSDFDLESDSDSASEVFAIDEEDVDENAATAMGPAVLDEDEDELDVSDAAMEEAESGAWDVDEAAATPSAASRAIPMSIGAGSQPEWGGVWVSLLGVASVLMLLLAFVGFDVVRNLYEFRGDGPASGLVKMLSGLMG